MDLRLKQERLEYYACVLDRTVEDVFTTDVVVPDTLADVGEVMLADGDFCLWRLDLNSGSAEAEGEWKGSVCYRAEDGDALLQFPVSVGVRLRVHDDAIEPDVRPFADCRVTDVTVQVMNTRKVRLKVRAVMSLQGYASRAMDVTSGVEDPAGDLFFKTTEHPCSMVAEAAEQVFTVGGRTTLREAPDHKTILAYHSQVVAGAPQRSGTRAILHGTILTTLLYQTSETMTPMCETIETSFSQLLDLDTLTDSDHIRCRLQLTSSELIPHEGADLETEFHVVVQMLCVRQSEVSCLSDAYSVKDTLELCTDTFLLERQTSTDAVVASAEMEIQNTSGTASVVGSFATLHSLRTVQDIASGTIAVTVLLSNAEGGLFAERAEAAFEQKLPDNSVLCAASVRAVTATITGACLQVRVPVELQYNTVTKTEMVQVVSMERSDTAGRGRALSSVTLIPREDQADLWELAKKYGSSIDAIREANLVPEGEKTPEYCLIPRITVG